MVTKIRNLLPADTSIEILCEELLLDPYGMRMAERYRILEYFYSRCFFGAMCHNVAHIICEVPGSDAVIMAYNSRYCAAGLREGIDAE